MGGVAGNERLTGSVGAALVPLLVVESATLLVLSSLLSVHIFVGVLLIPVVLLKLASTGYRFVRYYTEAYGAKGPPPALLRWSAPPMVLLTILLLASGVALLLFGPGTGGLLLIDKAAFIVLTGFIAVHVLGHARRVPRLASADWRRAAPEAAVAGASRRIWLLAAALASGVVLGFASLPLAEPWLNLVNG